MRNEKGQFVKGSGKGEDNVNWKGDDVGYFSLHTWVSREKGKATVCVDCGSTKNVQWANISGDYKRDLKDWKTLCCICHRRFDGITKFTREEADAIRLQYDTGATQKSLSKIWQCDQATISNIINNKIQYYG